jgi:RNA polymerase sigma-70 factor (ECF subfamily)
MHEIAPEQQPLAWRLPWKRSVRTALTPTELAERYLRIVLAYVSSRLGAGAPAEDVTAEVFAAALGAFEKCPRTGLPGGDDPVRAWLFGIARRKIADALRHRSRHPQGELDSETRSAADGPERVALDAEAAGQLRTILESLPDDQQEALRLKYVEELSLIEIGMVLRRSPAAVGTLLHRARAAARARGWHYFGEEETR